MTKLHQYNDGTMISVYRHLLAYHRLQRKLDTGFEEGHKRKLKIKLLFKTTTYINKYIDINEPD